jgi:hypothetical protein
MPTPAALFGLIVFSAIGFGVFLYGKRTAQWKPLVIGIALMVYPYFVAETWILYAFGCALCLALILFRD